MLIAVQLIPILNVQAEEALVITTYGENGDGINPNLVTSTATLTINDIRNGDILTAYKILDCFYNNSTNEITYDFTSDFEKFLEQSTEETYKNLTVEQYYALTSDIENGVYGDEVLTTSTVNILVSKYAAYLRKNEGITGIDMATQNYTATSKLEAGAYLILPKTIMTIEKEADMATLEIVRNLYGVMVGNIVFTANSNGWELNDCEINAKVERNFNRTFLGSFNTEKLFSGNLSEEEMSHMFLELSSVLGKKHVFFADLGIPDLPTNAINKVFQLEIELPIGITYNLDKWYAMTNESCEISDNKILDSKGMQVGTINFNGQKITATIDADLFLYDYITFLTDVELNEYATVGDEGNKITTKVTVTDDPYIEGSVTTLENSVVMTTYGLELTSYSEVNADGANTLLKGAKYEIYSKYTNSVLSDKIGEFTVGDDGKASFAGVPYGTIYLKQVKAPTGYQLIKEPIAVEIATENAEAGTKEGYYQVITYNDAMWYLPSTGGIGTIIYTLIGLLVIGISSVFVIKYKNVKNSSLV